MAQRPKLTRDDVDAIRDRLRRGETKTVLAKAYGCSPRALGFALDRYPADREPVRLSAGDEAREAQDDAAALGVADGMSIDEQRAVVVRQLRQAEAARDTLAAAGELSESRRYAELALKASSVLARLTRDHDVDSITIPRSELEAVKARARAKWQAALKAHGQIVCSHCRREIANRWAHDPLAPKVDGSGDA